VHVIAEKYIINILKRKKKFIFVL